MCKVCYFVFCYWCVSHLFEELVKVILIIASIVPQFLLILSCHRGNRNNSRRKVEEIVKHSHRGDIWQNKRQKQGGSLEQCWHRWSCAGNRGAEMHSAEEKQDTISSQTPHSPPPKYTLLHKGKEFRLPYGYFWRSIKSCRPVRSWGTGARQCCTVSTWLLCHECSPGEDTGDFSLYSGHRHVRWHHQQDTVPQQQHGAPTDFELI